MGGDGQVMLDVFSFSLSLFFRWEKKLRLPRREDQRSGGRALEF